MHFGKDSEFRLTDRLSNVSSYLGIMRKLKYHEQKLLKKVDFINWEADNNLHEVRVLRKYHIQKREDYTALVWNRIWNILWKALKFFLVMVFKKVWLFFNLYRYNKLSRNIREVARKIKDLDPKNPFRLESGAHLLEKL